jgi:hypothetical protein
MSYLDLLLVFLVGPILVLGMAVAVAEAVTIQQGIWWIDSSRSVPWRVAGVPPEDVVIFLVGTVFVVQTVMFAADLVARQRIRMWTERLVVALRIGRRAA